MAYTLLEVQGHSFANGAFSTGYPGLMPFRWSTLLANRVGVPETNLATDGGAAQYTTGWIEVLQTITRAAHAAPYGPGSSLVAIEYGANDLGWEAPGTGFPAYRHAIRTILSRYRASAVFEDSHASCSYDGTWSAQASTAANSGAGYRRCTTNGGVATIAVPADYGGQAIALGFVALPAQGALHTIRVDGVVHGQLDTRSIATTHFGALGFVYRLVGLAPGAHTITITADTVATETRFDYWQIETDSTALTIAQVLTCRYPPGTDPDFGRDFLVDDTATLECAAAERAVAGEFAANVITVDIDAPGMNSGGDYWLGGHPNDPGHAKIADLVYQALFPTAGTAVVVETAEAVGWRWVLQDPDGSTITTLTGASARKLAFKRNETPEVSFQVDPGHDDAARIVAAVAAGTPLLRCFREERTSEETRRVCRFGGVVLPVDDDLAEEATITVTARGAFEVLAGRETDEVVDFPFVDAGEIVRQLLADAEAEHPTGIAVGAIEDTVARDITYEFKNVADAIVELSQLEGGFDFEIVPEGEGELLGRLNVWAEQGADQPGAVFGHGAGTVGNVGTVKRTTSRPRNKVRVIGDEGVFQVVADAGSIVRYGLWSHTDQMADAIDADVLTARALELLQPEPIRTVEFTPNPAESPAPWTDYWLGDRVRLHVRRGAVVIDATPRIDGVEITLDDDGFEVEHRLTIAQDLEL